MRWIGILWLAATSSCSHRATTPPTATPAKAPAWIERSNANTQLVLAMQAKLSPESAAELGVAGIDDQITDFTPGYEARLRDACTVTLAELERRLAAERDPLVAQDLQIVIDSVKRTIKSSALSEKLEVQYTNVPELVFGSMHGLLDAQVAPARRPAALVRLKKYLGLDGGAPVMTLIEAEVRDGLSKGLLPPARAAIEDELAKSEDLARGIDQLFATYPVDGSTAVLKTMHEQLAAHRTFVEQEVLPKARTDFRLPPELYAMNLEQVGVDIPPAELATRAHAAFAELQAQMQTVATAIAKQRGWAKSDYRDVIAELKKAQIPDDKVLALYTQRLADIETIIREHHLLTLPARPALVRLGTPAENAAEPSPHMQPPRLVGNTGERGQFVLPLSVPGAKAKKYDDFSFDAETWTLTAHEARPGHELQFSRMIETGVSLARALYAFNSVNVEGWGLYSEAITLPYMPLEGQLISLQERALRAARAFLDPELEIPGKWTPESARAFLEHELVYSPALAEEEVDRYTFRMPGQATAYYYGFSRLMELRGEVEHLLGARFDAQRFHDAVLAQGLLPPALLRKAVLADLQP